MILRKLAKAWEAFFFTPQSPLPIALFRIFYGLCVAATIILLHADWLNWFGVHGWVSQSAMKTLEPGMRLNLFSVLPQNDHWVSAFFWIFLGLAAMLTLGLWTRFSSVAVFLCLTSIQQRNLLITHSGDAFLRIAGFFLLFAPAGAVLSLDRMIRLRRGIESRAVMPRAPWAQRMIQFQLALMYVASFLWKIKGNTWLQGTALYYVIHLHSVARFPLPAWIGNVWLLKIGSRFALALELALGTLIWFRRFRYPLLLLGLVFHLSLEYALNLPMFQWDVLSAYVLFVDPADIERVWRGVNRRWLKGQTAES